jgi:predicted RNase H-like HicB family nuclease
MKNLFLDIVDFVNYDVLQKPLPEAPQVAYKQNFIFHKEKNGYWLESRDFPGLIASGRSLKGLRTALFDAMLTYFDVPRPTAKRMQDPLILYLPNGRVVRPATPTIHYLAIKTAAA